jgi:hypothetical protein
MQDGEITARSPYSALGSDPPEWRQVIPVSTIRTLSSVIVLVQSYARGPKKGTKGKEGLLPSNKMFVGKWNNCMPAQPTEKWGQPVSGRITCRVPCK